MTTRFRPRPVASMSGPRAQPSESPAPASSAAIEIKRAFVDIGRGGYTGPAVDPILPRGRRRAAGGRARRSALAPVARQIEEALVAEKLVESLAELAEDHAEDARVGDELHGLLALGPGGVGEALEELVLGEADEADHQPPLEGGAEAREGVGGDLVREGAPLERHRMLHDLARELRHRGRELLAEEVHQHAVERRDDALELARSARQEGVLHVLADLGEQEGRALSHLFGRVVEAAELVLEAVLVAREQVEDRLLPVLDDLG